MVAAIISLNSHDRPGGTIHRRLRGRQRRGQLRRCCRGSDSHPHQPDGKGIAGPQAGAEVIGQNPTIIQDDGVGLTEVVDVVIAFVVIDFGVAPGNVGISKHNVALRVAADDHRALAFNRFFPNGPVYPPI